MGEKGSYFGSITYAAILVILIIAVFGPHYAYIPFSSEVILGMGVLLVAYTLGLITLNRLELFKEFRVGPGGFVGITKDLERQSNAVEKLNTEPPSKEVKELVNEIKETERNPPEAFLGLIGQIERLLSDIHRLAYAQAPRSNQEAFEAYKSKYYSVPRMVSDLVNEKIISNQLGKLIMDFWGVRNKIVHGRSMDDSDLANAIFIGERVISELDRLLKMVAPK